MIRSRDTAFTACTVSKGLKSIEYSINHRAIPLDDDKICEVLGLPEVAKLDLGVSELQCREGL
jgi:hypothetical protein